MSKKITGIGQYDSKGNYTDYAMTVDLVQVGDTLRMGEDGMVFAVKDDYGDWVSPILRNLGIKSVIKIKIEEVLKPDSNATEGR